jgi:hypothetical protein
MRSSRAVLTAMVVTLVAAAACGGSDGGDDVLPPPAEGEGFQVSMEVTVPAGEEIWLCQVSEIPGVEFTPVNHVESVQTAGVHHMDVMALQFAGVDLEPGLYDCNDVYADYPELMDDGLILYAAQQAEQEITLPPGTVANLPGGLTVMQELHYVNTTPEDIDAFSKINIYRYEGDIEEQIWGGAVRDTNLNVPPGESIEWTRCVMTDDVDILFLSSHTHQLARKFEIRMFDGETVGELIYENDDWATPALKSFGDAPLHVPAGQGFEFQCHYSNDTSETVNWGFAAADEMCQIALVFTPGYSDYRCDVVETSDGVIP